MSGTNSRFQYKKSAEIALPVHELFLFQTNIHNICQMIPKNIKVRILEGSERLVLGDTVRLLVTMHGVSFTWESVIDEYQENEYFSDRMIRGPFKSWSHKHVFEQTGKNTVMTDIIKYDLYLGPFGFLADLFLVRSMINNIFTARYNFDVTQNDKSGLIRKGE